MAMSSKQEYAEILAFVAGSDHGWTHQPTARVVNAGFDTNPNAECIEITVMVGHTLSDVLNDYKSEVYRVFSMAGARLALGY